MHGQCEKDTKSDRSCCPIGIVLHDCAPSVQRCQTEEAISSAILILVRERERDRQTDRHADIRRQRERETYRD